MTEQYPDEVAALGGAEDLKEFYRQHGLKLTVHSILPRATTQKLLLIKLLLI